MEPFPATLETLARELGVNKTTVSRALRNDPRISVGQRERVHELARERGYRKHPFVSALMSSIRANRAGEKECPVAYLCDRTREEILGQPHMGKFFLAAGEEAKRLGYRLDLYSTREMKVGLRRMEGILRARGVDGVVLAPFEDIASAAEFGWGDFCAVALGYPFVCPRMTYVENDQTQIVMLALEKAREAGAGSVGMVLHIAGSHPLLARYEMPYALVRRHPSYVRMRVAPQHTYDDLTASSAKSTLKWFETHRPEVIISNDDRIYEFLLSQGHRCPENFLFILTDIIDPASPFGGVVQNYQAVAQTVMHMLDSKLQRYERGLPEVQRATFIEGHWREGASFPGRFRRAGGSKVARRQAKAAVS